MVELTRPLVASAGTAFPKMQSETGRGCPVVAGGGGGAADAHTNQDLTTGSRVAHPHDPALTA